MKRTEWMQMETLRWADLWVRFASVLGQAGRAYMAFRFESISIGACEMPTQSALEARRRAKAKRLDRDCFGTTRLEE